MRREERHHLKENPLATAVTQLQSSLSGSRRAISAIVGVVALALVAGSGYVVWQTQQADRAGERLANALIALGHEVVPPPSDTSTEDWKQPADSFPSEAAKLEAVLPKLLAVAAEYPELPAGITARYEAAAALVRLERLDEAAQQYQRVIDTDGPRLHGSMARLGLAETYVLRGDYANAVALLEPETETEKPAAPVDAVLMRLGRAHELAGQDVEALAAFTRVVEEFPFSIYLSQARQKVDALE